MSTVVGSFQFDHDEATFPIDAQEIDSAVRFREIAKFLGNDKEVFTE